LIFTLICSLGGALVDESLEKFNEFVKKLSNWVVIDAQG
jgi:hypothetical protein